MSMTDQARCYLALREHITRIREEMGEDVAWHIVEAAVRANMESERIYIHRVSGPRLKKMLTNSAQIQQVD